MSVEIKFNAETSAKVHEEMLEFSRLFLGGGQVVTQHPVKIEVSPQVIKEITAFDEKQEPAQTETKIETAPEKKAPRRRAAAPKTETTEKEETEEKTEDPEPVEKEETEESEQEEVKVVTKEEPKGDNVYGPGFEGCETDEQVINQVRAYVNVFNNTPGNPPKAKAIFATYGVATVPKLSVEQAIDFYNKLKAI